MKKRNSLNATKVLRICIGSLLGLALLTTHHSFSSRSRRRDINRMILSSVAPEFRVPLQNTRINPEWTKRNVRVWVPVELDSDNSFCDPATANYSDEFPLSPASLRLPHYIVAVDIPEPEPMPALLYSCFVAAFGLVGFFVAAPATVRPLPRYPSTSSYRSH